jgi:hypothetical protein
MIVFERAIPYGNTRSVVVGPIADSITSASTALMLLMSALGQKQTSDCGLLMSAIPPKADIDGRSPDVRFVPKADSCTQAICAIGYRPEAFARGLFHRVPGVPGG